ncbi:uncharacterized protein LOC129872578 [Solanum dulcamara]|uniref:uncharacterized protein LOC129872578 n=1 Tax=Solanum dulcamara TaxID=45834 RepID=UPI0024854C34|nr:uncharacterized protein LOC129872578 [Solanum dulcamara]
MESFNAMTQGGELVSRFISLPKAVADMVEVEFDNGNVYNLSAEYLRICSPAVVSGRRHVGIMSAEPIGIMRLLFGDLHKTGIFMWNYLYHLGSNKFTLMRDYINTLKKHGLSRDPPSPRRNNCNEAIKDANGQVKQL